MKDRYAPSAVELLRIVDETLDAYFALPVSQFHDLLQDLVNGLDIHLSTYATEAIGSCGKSFSIVICLVQCINEAIIVIFDETSLVFQLYFEVSLVSFLCISGVFHSFGHLVSTPEFM